MKRKETDQFSSKKILEKAHKYVSPRCEDELPDNHGKDIKINKPLRKATEADKERKREKARLKRWLKKSQGGRSNNAKTEAVAYLMAWKKDRSNWTFKKTRQIWLLRNIYNLDNISDEHFKILLKYLMGLQGAARDRLIQEAESKMHHAEESDCMIHENQDAPENSEAESKEKIQEVLRRARNILQTVV